MYRVELSKSARQFFEATDTPLERKLLRCFASLASDPAGGNNTKPLTGEYRGYRRYRVGEHRVIYRIIEEDGVVLITRIAPRSSAYD